MSMVINERSMEVMMRLLKSETIKDLLKHNQRSGVMPPRRPSVDVHGLTCVHEHFVGAAKCGRPVPKDAAHGFLCTLHLNERFIKGKEPKGAES